MITIRQAQARGAAHFGWLDSRHTFSFGSYHDPAHMGFGPLRVINEDRVQPGAGFETHGHQDMEIVSYVLSGALAHKDSMGNGSVIRPGEVQVMSAGTGVRHSEFNDSKEASVHFLQLWMLPERAGVTPRYEQKTFTAADTANRFRLVGSPDGRDGSVLIQSTVDLYTAKLAAGHSVQHEFGSDRIGWLQVAHGTVALEGQTLSAGDGAAIEEADAIRIAAVEDAEVLLFDMAP